MKYIFARDIKSSDNESTDFLCINNCGAFVDMSEDITTSRPNGRFDYQMIYVKKGAVEVIENGVVSMVESGRVILFRPHEPQLYIAQKGCTFYWIHFSGTGVDGMLSYFTERSLKTGNIPEFEEFCEVTVTSFASKRTNYSLYCTGKLISLFATVSQKISADAEGDYEMLGPAVLDMHTNFARWRSNDEYAEMCGLSKSHFIRIFHEHIGMPPQKYRTAVAMREARHLLKSNSVTSTANILGYTDVFYFSRVFKKTVGVSPNDYKKQ